MLLLLPEAYVDVLQTTFFTLLSVEECIFDYMASDIECRFNENFLLQCYFLAILPAGFAATSGYASAKIFGLTVHG